MTYEWVYIAGLQLPFSPINAVHKVLNNAISIMRSDKILMGQNLYCYDWTLPFVQEESFARAISLQQAISIAREHGVELQFYETAQAPFFNYIDTEDLEHN